MSYKIPAELPLQETFEKVATHLITQGKPASDGRYCKLRTSNGLKCSVGYLIPDEGYDSDWDSSSTEWRPDSTAINGLFSNYRFNCDFRRMMAALQRLHDSSFRKFIGNSFFNFNEYIILGLPDIARSYGLNLDFLNALKEKTATKNSDEASFVLSGK